MVDASVAENRLAVNANSPADHDGPVRTRSPVSSAPTRHVFFVDAISGLTAASRYTTDP